MTILFDDPPVNESEAWAAFNRARRLCAESLWRAEQLVAEMDEEDARDMEVSDG